MGVGLKDFEPCPISYARCHFAPQLWLTSCVRFVANLWELKNAPSTEPLGPPSQGPLRTIMIIIVNLTNFRD